MPNNEIYNPNIAHIISEDGLVFQVLNDLGDDWDEEATRKAYYAWMEQTK